MKHAFITQHKNAYPISLQCQVLGVSRALQQLTRIQHHRIRIAQGDPVTGVSTISAEQAKVFSALEVKRPAASQQLSLL